MTEDSSIRVLLIEDSVMQTKLIRGILANHSAPPFSVDCADSLTAGLKRLALGNIDLVLLDLALPDSEGLATFLQVRRVADVPIVVLTGLDDKLLAVTAVQEGAEDYLIKGQVEFETLTRSLRFAIERNRRRHAEGMLNAANHEFRAARAIQEKLFPTVPDLASFDIGGMSYCAVGTCGDYFDYIRMSNDSIGIVIADVCGHGLGPSLLMASMRAYLRALARTYDDVGEILTIASRILFDDTKGDGFVTMFFGRLNPLTRSFVYANAGHPSGYVLGSQGVVKSSLDSGGFPLGVTPEATYQTSSEITLEHGDTVALLSDGLLEASSSQGSKFGKERTLNTIRLYLEEGALQIVENLYFAARVFSRNAEQEDDITAVVLKVGSQ